MTQNPARQALTNAVKRAIAEGAPVYVEKRYLCVAFFDQLTKPQCERVAVRRDGLCREHGAEWERITNDHYRVTLHD